MSRSGYSEDYDCDEESMRLANLYRASTERSIKGKRGQALLRDLLGALDAMPVKELVYGEFATPDGAVCALGCVGKARGVKLDDLDPIAMEENQEWSELAKRFNIAESLAREVMAVNDGDGAWISHDETPAKRWTRMRKWVAEQVQP